MRRITFDGKVTRAFDGAHVRGRSSKAVIDDNRAITVRFQVAPRPREP